MMTAFWDAMFPPQEAWPRYAECGVRKHPRAGDISCRSALTIHRGTVHPSQIARPVLVLGVDAPPSCASISFAALSIRSCRSPRSTASRDSSWRASAEGN